MSPGQPVERVRGERPAEGRQEDSLARSDHGRVLDFLQQPLDDDDPDRAVAICSEVTRNALGDFAPAMMLLPADRRPRLQALVSYSLMLFDFALQPGTEGERLAELNRWEFDRERAFDGEPAGQPVFVALAVEHRRSPFDPDAFDSLGSLARQVAVQPRPRGRAQAERRWRALAESLVEAFASSNTSSAPDPRFGDPPTMTVDLVLAALRLRRLQGFRDDLSLTRTQVPLDEWPARADDRPEVSELKGFTRQERRRIRDLLGSEAASRRVRERDLARPLSYLGSASRLLLDRLDHDPRPSGPAPRVNLGARLALLAKALLFS